MHWIMIEGTLCNQKKFSRLGSLGSKPWAHLSKPRLDTCKAVYHPYMALGCGRPWDPSSRGFQLSCHRWLLPIRCLSRFLVRQFRCRLAVIGLLFGWFSCGLPAFPCCAPPSRILPPFGSLTRSGRLPLSDPICLNSPMGSYPLGYIPP